MLLFEEFQNSLISVNSYTEKELYKTWFDSETHLMKDKTIRDRIKFSDAPSFGSNIENNYHFIILYYKEKIIGMCSNISL